MPLHTYLVLQFPKILVAKMKYPLIMFLGFLHLTVSLLAQSAQDSVIVMAKKWSRDKNRNIVYSDWTAFKAMTVGRIGVDLPKPSAVSRYGGNLSAQFNATGFFRIEKNNGKHWMVDPEGNAFIGISLNSVRKGSSPQHERVFAEKYGTDAKWMTGVKQDMKTAGFNMLGSWSDTAAIRAFNRLNPGHGIVYTTQLSLLSGFVQQQKKNDPSKKEWPILAFLFDPGFENYCRVRCEANKNTAADPWLAGHFSDNELPFQNNLIKEFISLNDPVSAAYHLATNWVQTKSLDTAILAKDQQENFSGYVASVYYRIVSAAIKKSDPNHLYLGSRLHSSAKYNPYLLKACEQYCDIISINYYGNWTPKSAEFNAWNSLNKPFMITEFYTKAEDSGLPNITGAGWLVKTQQERGIFYQNFCLSLLASPNCVGWHWFRYQDNDPTDPKADPSNNDSNKGLVNNRYEVYLPLAEKMLELNQYAHALRKRTLGKQ